MAPIIFCWSPASPGSKPWVTSSAASCAPCCTRCSVAASLVRSAQACCKVALTPLEALLIASCTASVTGTPLATLPTTPAAIWSNDGRPTKAIPYPIRRIAIFGGSTRLALRQPTRMPATFVPPCFRSAASSPLENGPSTFMFALPL